MIAPETSDLPQTTVTNDPSEHYFPVINDVITPMHTLAPVISHQFPDTPSWQQGIIVGDATVDQANKMYLAVRDFQSMIDTMAFNQANHNIVDAHLYELMTENRPVRPYFDLEWDSAQLDEV